MDRAGFGITAGRCVRRLRAISVRELELSDGVPVADKQGGCPGEKKSGLPGTKRGSNVPGEENFGVPGTKWGLNVPGRVRGEGMRRG